MKRDNYSEPLSAVLPYYNIIVAETCVCGRLKLRDLRYRLVKTINPRKVTLLPPPQTEFTYAVSHSVGGDVLNIGGCTAISYPSNWLAITTEVLHNFDLLLYNSKGKSVQSIE